jgi:hypothetical protein
MKALKSKGLFTPALLSAAMNAVRSISSASKS